MRHFVRWRFSRGSRIVRITSIAALLALTFAAGSLFTAMGDPAPATYSACVSAQNNRVPSYLRGTFGSGSLYNVTVDGTPQCNSGDALITWNSQGVAGPSGATGPSGPSGPAGVLIDCDESNLHSGTNLTKCQFPDANWETVLLDGATMDWINLENAHLTLIQLPGAIAVESNFNGSTLTQFIAYTANFSNASFNNAIIENGDFFSAVMFHAQLANATFTSTYLDDANLRYAEMFDATFTDSSLEDADMTDAVNVATVTWSNTICPDGTNSDNNGNTCVGHLTP